MEPCEVLANAIVVQAARDYRRALKNKRDDFDAQRTCTDIERFFKGEWIRELTSVSGAAIMDRIRSEVY